MFDVIYKSNVISLIISLVSIIIGVIGVKLFPDVYITDWLPRLHGKTATQKRCFSHSDTIIATLPI